MGTEEKKIWGISKSVWLRILAGVAAIAGICFVFPSVLIFLTGTDRVGPLALYGDMFGVLNTFFAGIAFLGVIATLLVQAKELEENRELLRRATIAQEAAEQSQALQLRSNVLSARLSIVSRLTDSLLAHMQKFNQPAVRGGSVDFEAMTLRQIDQMMDGITGDKVFQGGYQGDAAGDVIENLDMLRSLRTEMDTLYRESRMLSMDPRVNPKAES